MQGTSLTVTHVSDRLVAMVVLDTLNSLMVALSEAELTDITTPLEDRMYEAKTLLLSSRALELRRQYSELFDGGKR